MTMTWLEQPKAWERTLDECEAVIERGQQTFVEVGLALLEIRDNRLYREDWRTFEDYCQERWGWQRRHAYELIDAAGVIGNVRSNAQTLPSLTQAVQLAPLPPADQRAIAQEIDFTQTTVRDLREIVRERKEIRSQAEAHAERSVAIAERAAAETAAPPGDLYDRVVIADARDYLPRLRPEDYRAHVCLTSPPYWAKRDYGAGDAELGQEDSPDEYVAAIVAICDLIGEVLTEDGWLFLNVADTYASQPGQYRGDPNRTRGVSTKVRDAAAGGRGDREFGAIPEKSRCLIPERIAVALVERGWRLRNVNIWHKIGHQPENVFDRSAQAWEPVYQLTRAAHPYYARGAGDDDHWEIPVGRNGKGGSHPAVFPDELVERVLTRACPPSGVVLDPFAGSGTVLHVAQRLERRFLGCDLIDWGANQ